MKTKKKFPKNRGASARALNIFSSPRSIAIIALGFLVVTALAYYPAWWGKPIWDDDGHLTKPELQSPHGLVRIWTEPGATQQYYPLVHSVFWLQQKLWGDALLPYHLLNILLHGASAFLLFRILLRLRIPGALLAAAIFALHPVQVESVAWISELKNTLSGFFFLAAAWAYLHFDEKRTPRFYFLAGAFFLCGLLSKSVIATLPPALLVVFWWQRGRLSFSRDVRPLLPFFALAVLGGLVTVWIEHHFIGAHGEEFDASFLARGLIAGRVFWFYLGKLFWPENLTFIYPRWEVNEAIWWQYLFPAALLLGLALLWKWRARSRGPLAAVLFFLGTLFPVLGFINVFPFIYSFVADHFQYLASIGIITLTAAAIALLIRRLPSNQQFIGQVFAGLIPLTLTILTWRQSHIYADAELLYRTTIARNPTCWMAQNNLANLLLRNGAVTEAIPHYNDALRLRPRYLEAHYNLGYALLQVGNVEGSIDQCEAALAIDPKSAEANTNLGNALLRTQRFREALDRYEAAFRTARESPTVQINLASMLATCGDVSLRDGPRALELATSAVRLTGGKNPIALSTLGAAYAQTNDFPHAISATQQALQLAEARGDESLIRVVKKQLTLLQNAAAQQPTDSE